LATVATIHSESLPGSARPPRCQLVVVEGPDAGRAVVLAPGASAVAGTGDECDLVLTDDRVSRRHMEVVPEDGRYVVRDLASTNGTLYEGSLVTELRVSVGATFKLGRTFVRIQPQPEPLEVAPSRSRRFGDLVGESLVLREVFAVLELAADSDVTVLLEGETGTGKELAARAIHEASARRKGPFVAIDCGALPDSLLESELFGHVKGAFTGADRPRLGAFARAHGGTIFLDELAGMPASVQARLLRVLEERRVRPVGSDTDKSIDVRVVAASRTDLSGRVAEGDLRPDLYYRLSVVKVSLPPLRARREDIAPIVKEILRLRGLDAGRIGGPNLDRLMAHPWPGNARELRNVIDRAVTMSPGATSFAELRLSLAPAAPGNDPLAVRTDLGYAEAKAALLAAFEARYLRDLLTRCEGNISAASRVSGLDRKHLRSLLRRHALIPVRDDDADADTDDVGP
jgi:DNA-binding NtrC family response regulator